MPDLVLLLLLIPLAAAMAAALLGSVGAAAVRWVSLAATVTTLVMALILAGNFAKVREREEPLKNPTFRPAFVPGASPESPKTTWRLLQLGNQADEAVQFYVGIDGLNIWLIVLTAVLMVPAVLVSWQSVQERVPEFHAWLLALETGMIGVFLSFDIILFYVFFELTLVPLFFLIGIWGGPQRRYAARKFFIYTLAGSLITFLGLLGIVVACYSRNSGELTFSIPRLVEIVHHRLAIQNPGEQAFWHQVQMWVFLAMMVGFAVKVPLVPLHTWLPLAHVEAPTAGSVLLAGVLLKIGAYGFLRLCLPLAPDASLAIGVPLIGSLAVVGIIYGAFCALAQDDIKKLVAYSSVSHLGFCLLGLFALNATGLSGGLLQMINHGLSTGALFLLVGMLYERYHTRMVADYGGLASRLRLLSCFMVFFCLTSIGLPGLNGFVGEVLVLTGMFQAELADQRSPVLAVLGAFGIVLGAWYLLTMLQRVFFGPLKEPAVLAEPATHGPITDLNWRELAALVPIALLCLVIGVYPQPLLDASRQDLKVVADLAGEARYRAKRGDLIVQPTPPLTEPVAEILGEEDKR